MCMRKMNKYKRNGQQAMFNAHVSQNPPDDWANWFWTRLFQDVSNLTNVADLARVVLAHEYQSTLQVYIYKHTDKVAP